MSYLREERPKNWGHVTAALKISALFCACVGTGLGLGYVIVESLPDEWHTEQPLETTSELDKTL